MGKNLSQQCPRHRTERHGIDRDGRYHECHHQNASQPHEVAGAKCQVNQAETSCTQQHQRAASPLFNGVEGNEREDDVGNACDDDIDEHAIDVETRTHEYLLSIVEDDVRAAPLLENSNYEAQKQYLTIFMLQQFT